MAFRGESLMADNSGPTGPWPSDRALSEISLGCGCLSLIGVGAPVVTDSKLVMWGFIVVGTVGLAMVIVLRIARYFQNKKKQSLISLLLGAWRSTLVAAIVVAGILLFKLVTLAKPISLDQTVQFSCEWSQLPTVMPQHKLYELELVYGIGGAFIAYSQQPGAPANLINPDAPTYTYRCRFHNLGTASLVNVATEMTLLFMESVKSSDGTKSGAVLASYNVDTPLITLGAGEIFDFYVRNYSAVYANIALPTTATGQIVGSDAFQTFRLIQSQATRFGMPPFDRQDPAKPANVPLPVPRPTH
jgi:hypothetical protein